MSRPRKIRRVGGLPSVSCFMPAGCTAPKKVILSLDEWEALRLADAHGLSQERGAKSMEISRATFGRLLDEARRKVAKAITLGMALKIDPEIRSRDADLVCKNCGYTWPLGIPLPYPLHCPSCHSGRVLFGRGRRRWRGGRGPF